MSDTIPDPKFTPEEARALKNCMSGDAYRDAAAKLQAALAAHARTEKRAALGLPWSAYPEAMSGPAAWWKVCYTITRDDGAHCTERMLGKASEEQALLAAASPDLAEACEAAAELLRMTSGEGCAELDMLTAALRKSGWR